MPGYEVWTHHGESVPFLPPSETITEKVAGDEMP
jgi:hypothetical protein